MSSAPAISLPSGIFRCVEVDPPWQYRDRSFNGTNGTQRQRSHCPYPTMPVRDLFGMRSEVRRLLHPDGAHLWLWTTKDFLPQAFAIVEHWGFEFKQVFTWLKTRPRTSLVEVGRQVLDFIPEAGLSAAERKRRAETIAEFLAVEIGIAGIPTVGMGYWGRGATEFILFATTNPKMRLVNATREPNLFTAPRGKHSAKPAEAYDLIARNSPGPRCSLFQRTPRPGFVCWGNEIVEESPLPA